MVLNHALFDFWMEKLATLKQIYLMNNLIVSV